MAFRRMPLAFGQGEQGTKIQHELTVLTGQRVANFGEKWPDKVIPALGSYYADQTA